MRFHVIVACVFAAASWGMLLGQESPKSDDKGEEPKREAKQDQDEPAENSLAADYGFLPVEVFKLSPRIHNLTARDLNGDGCKDLVVVENGASRINVLFARGQMPDGEREKLEVNELRSTWRFDQHKIPVTRKIDALVTTDFNGDGVADLCYIGDNHLHLAKGEKEKGGKTVHWSQPSEKRLTDQTLPFAWRIAAADLDADGCDDLVTLGDTELLIVRGNKSGDLEKIERVANTSNKMNFLWVRDFDGDARPDIVMLSDEDPERSLVVRFQNSKGSFGPEVRFETPMPRAFDLAELDGKPGQEFLSIDAKTNRLKFFRCDLTPEQSDEPTSPIVQFGFGPRASKAGTIHVAPGDVNGDGRLDVVVVDGDAALMSVYLQDPKTGLGQAQQFPGLTGVRAIVLADIDGDKQAELLLASEREKVIGISKWRDGRMTFPEALPNVSDTPLALCLADFDGRGKRDIAYVASSRGSGGTSYMLRKLSHTAEMGWNHGEFGGMDAVPLDKLRSAPAEMLAVDADRDGRSDLMLLANNAPLTFLATDARGVPQVVDTGASSRLGNVSPGKVTVGELDGQAILITDKNFTRRVRLDAKGQWNVVDQYNAESFDAAITGSALIDLDGDGKREIVLVDVGTHRLRFLKQQNGVYRPWKDLPTGALNVQAVYVGDFNGDGREDLLLAGADRFGIAYTGLPGSRVELIGSFETQIKDSKPSDLIVGDLGGGKELDIAVIDHQQHRVEIITPRDGDWKSALTFKVFEASERSGAGAEPRELAVADVTGDGLDDLIMIVHDRVLLYPQDGGK